MGNLLKKLAKRYGSDKAKKGYLGFYEKYLEGHRSDFENMLEIGVKTGASIRMWHDYFINCTIHGIDLSNRMKNKASLSRVKTYVCDQTDKKMLKKLFQNIKFDLIIDDGGHYMNQQQTSFAILFDHLKDGGYYILEDLQTSFNYCKGGQYINKDSVITTYDMMKCIMNDEEFKSSYISELEKNTILNSIDFVDIFHHRKKGITSIVKKCRSSVLTLSTSSPSTILSGTCVSNRKL